ncbi:MAG TPA: lipid A export permease/ATP-binding protein MsbA [Legionellales bacterium]|jgi:subfamily B ATP-binding cassette protein MsbA|nr:lipid A export permease/ATP-binding protein MsbA [Legionellales bacterium]
MSSAKMHRRVFELLKPYWKMAVLGIIANCLYAGIDASFTYMMRPFMDKGFVNIDMKFIYQIPWIVLLGITLRGFMGGFGGYCMTHVARSMVNGLRQKVFTHLIKLPATVLDSTPSGQLLSKLLYDVEQVAQVSADAITDIVQNICLIIGLFGVMLIVSWQLTLIFMFAVPAIAFIVQYTNRRIRRISRQVQQSMGQVTEIASEVIDGFREIRMFETQGFVSKKFNDAAESSKRHDLKVAMSKAINVFGVQMILAIAMTIIIFAAIQLAKHITITPGTFVAITAAGLQLIKPMKTLTNLNATLQRGFAGAESIFQLLDKELEKDNGTSNLPAHVRGDIAFKNVYFAYQEGHWVLENFNMHIPAGQTIALVGASGSGKTTLINLLPRFYDIQQGQITLDDIPLENWSLQNLRQQFSWVSQHVILFNDSIAANIAYGDQNIDEERLWSAIKQADAYHFIQQLPDGLQTQIGENGLTLSGGQRQRLALARAIYKNAPIFILDEATAALDNQTEQHIQRALEQFHHQRTMIIIAHRLSTIQFADIIFVMNQGRIVEQGSHESLLAQNGHYANLYRAQHHGLHHEKTDSMV